MNEAEVLSYDPFEGDFGGPGDRTLTDKMVTARKARACHLCCQDIKPKMRIRVLSAILDGDLMSFAWCEECCKAMEKSWKDGGKALEARYHVG